MRFLLEVLLALIVSGVGVIAALIGEVDDAPLTSAARRQIGR